jgi:hypothetical protein
VKLKGLGPLSDCRLKAAYSGFWSTGMMRGLAAAVDLTRDDGGDQLVLAWVPLADDWHDLDESMARLK